MRVALALIGALWCSTLAGLASAQDTPPAPPVPASPSLPVITPALPPAAPAPLDASAGALDGAAKKLEAASKSLEAASAKLAPSTDPKELLAGRVPWNGLFLKFTEKDKKATVVTSLPFGDGAWTLGTEFTVPLDETTRRAPLLDAHGQQAPFQLKLSLDYNAMTDALAGLLRNGVMDGSKRCKRYLREQGSDQLCPGPQFRKWALEHPPTRGEMLDAYPDDLARRGPEDPFARALPLGVLYTLGAELSASFDRQDVYRGDLAASTTPTNTWDFSAGAVVRFFPRRWLAIPLRVGGKVADPLKTKEIDRCTALTSSSASITGKDCSKVLVLKSDDKVQGSGYLDAALDFALPAPLAWGLQPGLEARGRVDGIGAGAVTHLSGTLFVTPTDQPISLRFGVGMEYNLALNDDPGAAPSFQKGDRWLIPFVLAGGSL